LNFYEVLNIKTNANEKEIKKSYRILAKKYHPDTYQGDKNFAQEKMQEINAAYDTLSNPELRKKYDEKIGVNLQENESFKTYKSNTTYKSSYTKNTRYNPYNKDGVNYEVKYRPNNTRIRYDSNGYAESNYYTTQMDEDYYSQYDREYRRKRIKELLTGKKLIGTIIFFTVAIAILSVTLYNAFDAINTIYESASDTSSRVNKAKENSELQMQKDMEALKEGFSSMFNDIRKKEQELKSNINEYTKTAEETKDKKELLKELGVTDSDDQQEILDFIEQLNKN